MKKIILSLALLLATNPWTAGASDYVFRHITSREGLASNSVRAIVQDHLGLIWLGNGNGLDSYDGREVIHHPLPGGVAASVLCLLEDAGQTLWIGTDSGLYRYVGDDIVQEPLLAGAEVTAFAEDRDGNVWVATWGKGVFRFRDGQAENWLDGHLTEALLVGSDGRLWLADASSGEGLLVFHTASQTFVSPGLAFQDCSPTRICALDEDGNGDLWLGTWDSGIFRAALSTWTVHLAVPPGNGLHHIHSITHDGAWNFLVGSDDGLLEVKPQTGEQVLYRNDRKDPTSLSDKFVYPVTRDHEGGLWIGTYYGGVNYVAPNIGQFQTVSLSDLAGADEEYIVSCLCEDPDDGTVWIGSDNGGLFRYDPVRNKVGRWLGSAGWTDRLASLNVHALLREGESLWVGTYSSNLLRIDLRTGRVREFREADGLDAPSVYALCIDPDGTLWAGTNSGICRYDAAADRFVLERAAGGWVMDIRTGGDGALWFATARSGVLRRSGDGDWQSFQAEDGALPSDYVNCIHPSATGIFAGTSQGLAALSEKGSERLVDGMEVMRLAADGNQFWFSSGTAVVRYILSERRWEQFGANDGIYTGSFSPNAGTITRDGTIYLGASDGFVSFLPGSVRVNATPPPVLFTRFTASGPGLSMNVFLTQDRERLTIPWRMRDVNISFAALSYGAPEKVSFAYRLEGLPNPDWQDLGNQNYLSLSQLPAGRYRLQVIASNNSGVWNNEGATLSFTVRPHPLFSGFAVLLYALLAGVLFWLLGRWYLRRTEEKTHLKYERQLDEAVSHLKEEERDDRYQLVSSLAEQIEAPLAGIGLQLERLKEKTKAALPLKAELTVIEKNHRMLKNVSANLLQMRSTLRGEDGEPGSEPVQEDLLTRLDKIITENLANPDLSVTFLAKELAISRSGLFAKVKELCGETPNNLINQARLNTAAKLLSEGKHTVGEICYMTGFSSPSYFSKCFLNQFGVSPHEWAQTHSS